MVKFIRPSKAVIVLNGRYAGCKAVIVKNFDDGMPGHSHGCALVVGISKYPRRVTAKMTAKQISRRSRVKPFIKVLNYKHMMPTRYVISFYEGWRADHLD